MLNPCTNLLSKLSHLLRKKNMNI